MAIGRLLGHFRLVTVPSLIICVGLSWQESITYIHLVAPIRKTQEDFTLQIKNLTKGLLSGEIILSEYFSGYVYDEKKHLEDQAKWGEVKKKWESEFVMKNARKVRFQDNPDNQDNSELNDKDQDL